MSECLISRRGGSGNTTLYKLPKIDKSYPEDKDLIIYDGDNQSAVFSIFITEAGIPDEYEIQWYVDGNIATNGNGLSYTISGLSDTVTHTIYCTISNNAGTVVSRIATLKVIKYFTPTLDNNYPQDKSVSVIKGNSTSADFSVIISEDGSPNSYKYQWYLDDVLVQNATSPNYTVTGLANSESHTVYCTVSNEAGTVYSRTAALVVDQYYTPVLNSSYPQDMTIYNYGSATFSVNISTAGNPNSYTYQWYENNSAVSGATGSSYTKSDTSTSGTYTVYCKVTNAAGTMTTRTATLTIENALPTYTYSGSHTLLNDGNGNWRIRLLTTGSINFQNLGNGANGIQVFLVGGGGGAGGSTTFSNDAGGGGGGGYTKTYSTTVTTGTSYSIVIGAGGGGGTRGTSQASAGGTTTAFGFSASGGGAALTSDSTTAIGGNGGSGGGGGYFKVTDGGYGGSDGGNGWGYTSSRGKGQGTTTREFGETTGTLYAGGGGGGSSNESYVTYNGGAGGSGGGGNGHSKNRSMTAGTANTGGGGGGRMAYDGSAEYSAGASGGSGIVIIRNKR